MFNTLLVYPLLNLLIFIYAILPGHDFGVAVILVTVLIRLALWPIVGKQLHSQKKLQALQPEIAKIKKAAKGDRQKESQMTMELYREKEVSPFSSCLFLVIQLPFLLAFFSVFKKVGGGFDTIAPHLYNFVRNMPFVQNLIAHPSLYQPELFGVINLAKPNVFLAIFAGVTQFFQTRMLQPRKVEKGDQQTQMLNTVGMIFPVVTVMIALRLPSALALYWGVTSLIAILQQWLIMRGETEKMEEEVKVTKRIKS